MLCLVWLSGSGCLTQGATTPSQEVQDKLALAPGERRLCLSLRVLSKRVSTALATGAALPRELQNLGGIGYLEGFLVDDSGDKDVILVGRESQERPALHLDDLVVNLRNVGRSREYPYCSLDPRKQDVLALEALFSSHHTRESREDMDAFFQKVAATVGPQQVVVGGVPRNSRHAHVMIDADYHMKKVSQGHVVVPGVVSYLDLSLDEIKQAIRDGTAPVDEKASMSRFWFHLDPRKPDKPGYEAREYPIFQEARGIVWLEGCPVVVLTERQMPTATGELHDVDAEDPMATAFGAQFSRAFTNLTAHVPVYADLENLYRLRALLLAMRHRTILETVGWNWSTYLNGYRHQEESPMPDSLPGLANRREWSCQISRTDGIHEYFASPLVCGGVGQDMEVKDESFSDRNNSWLFGFKMTALFARPSKDSLVWEVRASKRLSRYWPRPFDGNRMPRVLDGTDSADSAQSGVIGDNQEWFKNATFSPPAWLRSDALAAMVGSGLVYPMGATDAPAEMVGSGPVYPMGAAGVPADTVESGLICPMGAPVEVVESGPVYPTGATDAPAETIESGSACPRHATNAPAKMMVWGPAYARGAVGKDWDRQATRHPGWDPPRRPVGPVV